MTDFSIIGKPIAMIDAAGKTTGAGKYTDDLSVAVSRVPGVCLAKYRMSFAIEPVAQPNKPLQPPSGANVAS